MQAGTGGRSERLIKLNSLVDRASVYSKFLADKLENGEIKSDVPAKFQPDIMSGCVMRDYQVVGVNWLISLYENGLNGILADEMGLGKTLQTIAFLQYLTQVGTHGPFLIVAPLSTLMNWSKEFEKFAPSLNTVMYYGTSEVRADIRNTKMKMKETNKKFPIIITSYEISMNDKKHLQKYNWRFCIVDEGQRIKNMDCKLIRDLKSYKTANRLLLTGTPIQNCLNELWSLLNFLMPQIFNDLGAFEEWFEFENNIQEGKSSNMINSLHQILKPFLLRRIKTEVMTDLPKKREYLLYAPMVDKQAELYSAILKKELSQVLEKHFAEQIFGSDITEEDSLKTLVGSKRKREDDSKGFLKKLVGSQNLQNSLVQLRKVCNHPYLFHIESSDQITYDEKNPEILRWSGKMLLLDRLLTGLINNGHRVLIFSQMTAMLDIIQDWLELYKKMTVCRIDGEVKLDERQSQIEEFKQNSELKVFLLSTRAGGLGINLTSADTVIIFDSDWNPQVDLQAQDRVHRIGQTRPVIVYRFITSDSIERKILDRAQEKRTLEKVVIHKNQFKGSKKYYQSNKPSNAVDIKDILEEEIESIHLKPKGWIATREILSDEELTRIMDRSDEAYSESKGGENFALIPNAINSNLF